MKNLILKLVIFSTFLCCCLYVMDPFFLENQNPSISSYQTLYEKDQNTVDIVFLGNSHQGKGLDTNIINAKCKVNSIKINGGGINIAQIYYNLLETLEYQTPKLVAIETWTLIEKGKRYNDVLDTSGNLIASPYKTEYNKRIGKVKFKEINHIYSKDQLFHMFNFLRFHDTWHNTERLSQSLKSILSYTADERSLNDKVNWNLSLSRVTDYKNSSFSTEGMLLTDNEKVYLNKIIDLSKEKGFNLLLYSIPVYKGYYNKTKSAFKSINEQLEKLSNGHSNVDFFDLNGITQGLDYTCMMNEKVSNNQHLNYKGKIKTSYLIANHISKTYSLGNIDNFMNTFSKTPENLVYNVKKSDVEEHIEGTVNKVNEQYYKDVVGKKVLTIKDNIKTIILEGWIYMKGLDSSMENRMIALKKNDNFVYLTSEEQMVQRRTPMLIKKLGLDYESSGYELKIPKNLLETGTYTIFHIVIDDEDNYRMKNTYKYIKIE